MSRNNQSVWTPKQVSRPTGEKFAMLCINAEWNQKADTLGMLRASFGRMLGRNAQRTLDVIEQEMAK